MISREMVLSGALAVGVAVAMTGWLGVALHQRLWGLPSQGLWRAASTLTYANATAALLVPLALVALARLTAHARPLIAAIAAAAGLALAVLIQRVPLPALALPAAGVALPSPSSARANKTRAPSPSESKPGL
jgi:hypothetical protein